MVTIERVKQIHGETEGWLRIQRTLPRGKMVKGILRHMTPHRKLKF